MNPPTHDPAKSITIDAPLSVRWFDPIGKWLEANDTLLWSLFAVSLGLFLATPLVVSWLVTRLPPDYFNKRRRPLESFSKTPTLRALLLGIKNTLGLLLAVSGVAMLMLPGQGLLTILASLLLLDFPGKFATERWIVSRPRIWRTINWLRRRARCEPLEFPVSQRRSRAPNPPDARSGT